jgi:hypothetical protein
MKRHVAGRFHDHPVLEFIEETKSIFALRRIEAGEEMPALQRFF